MEEGEDTTEGQLSDLRDSPETTKSGPLIQRSVAFDLAEDDEKQAEKHVKIGDVTSVTSEEKGDTLDTGKSSVVAVRKDSAGTAVRREIIGILKPPNPRKELKSFPSLPECFLHDLGLIENIALNAENLSEQDIENKFSSLSLAFKTDRVSLQERHELQLRQRDIAERNVEEEIRQLKSSIRSLNRVCQDSETRDVLHRVEKQIAVLHQSTGRVSSSSEQYGAVQQEARVATAIEIMLLHVDNLKRSYEKEHTELEETRRVLIEHKLLLVDDPPPVSPVSRPVRPRSVSVVQPAVPADTVPRRASLATQHSLAVQSLQPPPRPRERSPNPPVTPSGRKPTPSVGTEEGAAVGWAAKQEKKPSVFHSIPETREDGKEEEVETEDKNDDNNNAEVENMNKSSLAPTLSSSIMTARRRESRKVSHLDVNTIMEEIDELAVRRDSSPRPVTHTDLTLTARDLLQRRKSLLLQFSDWYSDLYWPYDEEETVLGLRYCVSGILTVSAVIILMATFFG